MRFDCAGSHQVCSAASQALGPGHFHCKFSLNSSCGDPANFLSNKSFRDPVECKSLREDLVEIVVKTSWRVPCIRSLQVSCLRGACMKALVGGACRWHVICSF